MRQFARLALEVRHECAGLTRRRKARALQQEAALSVDELEVEQPIGFTVLLEARQGALGNLGLLRADGDAGKVAQADSLAQFRHEGRRPRARLGRARLQDGLYLLRVVDEVLVAFAHGRDLAVDALEEALLRIGPGDAAGV